MPLLALAAKLGTRSKFAATAATPPKVASAESWLVASSELGGSSSSRLVAGSSGAKRPFLEPEPQPSAEFLSHFDPQHPPGEKKKKHKCVTKTMAVKSAPAPRPTSLISVKEELADSSTDPSLTEIIKLEDAEDRVLQNKETVNTTIEVKREMISNLNDLASLIEPVVVVKEQESDTESMFSAPGPSKASHCSHVTSNSPSTVTEPPSPINIPLADHRRPLADPRRQAACSSFAACGPCPPSEAPHPVAYGPRSPSEPPGPVAYGPCPPHAPPPKSARIPPWRPRGKHYDSNVARRDAMTPSQRTNDRAMRREKAKARALAAAAAAGGTETS